MADKLTELSDLEAFEVSLVKAGANRKKRFPIAKEEQMEVRKADEAVANAAGDLEAARKAIGELEKLKGQLTPELKALLAKLMDQGVDKVCGPKEDYNYPEVKKSVDDMTAKLETVNKAYETEIAALRTQLKAEADRRELGEWIEKARKDLAYYPGLSVDEMGAQLKALADINPELAQKQYLQMSSVSAMIAKSDLMRECGRSTVVPGGGSAWERIERQAGSLVEKDANASREKTIAKVLRANPALYREYLAEHPEQASGR